MGTAVTSGTGLTVVSTAPIVAGQQGALEPMLQLEDGSFVGRVFSSVGNEWQHMVAFDAAGGLRWRVPGETPIVATLGGGLIAASGTFFSGV